MTKTIGFLINPIAGMGGKVGLKGTDDVVNKAIKLGAKPIALQKSRETLEELLKYKNIQKVTWLTCSGVMGEHIFKLIKLQNYKIVYSPHEKNTCADDTKKVCQIFLKNKVDLILFCGGDGTARDIFSAVDKQIPILGIPSGVKMHSGIFGITTKATAKIVNEFIRGRLTTGDAEILDLDEKRYRKGEWNIKLFGIAKGFVEPTYIQVGKSTYETVSDDEIKEELAEHIEDEMNDHPESLYIFGSGGTTDFIASKIGIQNTILGIDAVYQKKLVGKDLNEQKILDLLKKYKKAKLILSPIGSQGFILGRGNLQLSANVIKKIGIDNIIVVATPSKLLDTPIIRVDTGDINLDRKFSKQDYIMVIIGYRLSRVVKIQTNNF